MVLLGPGQAEEELSCLVMVVGERRRRDARLRTFDGGEKTAEAGGRIFARPGRVDQARRERDTRALRVHLHVTIALHIGEWASRGIARLLMEVSRAEATELRIEVRKIAPVKQRIVEEVNSRHKILGAEGDLLGLGEDIGGAAVERQSPKRAQRHDFLRNDFRRVEVVEVEGRRLLPSEQLDAKLPHRTLAIDNRGVKIAAVIIRIGPVDLDRLVLDDRLHVEQRRPVKLDEGRLALGVDQPEAVDAKALHHPIPPRYCPIGNLPHEHMHRLGRTSDPVPEGIVRRLRLRELRSGCSFNAWARSGDLMASWMQKTGMLSPTRSQLPSGVYILTAKPQTSRARSNEPRSPATVEKRTNTGVCRLVSDSTRGVVDAARAVS